MSDQILTHIRRHILPGDAEITIFLDLLQPVQVGRRDVLLREGQACRYLYFIEEGALRAFFAGPRGKEHTIMFAVSDWWITDMYCYLNQLPAMVSIEALQDTQLLQLERSRFDTLLQEAPVFEKFFRILMQNAYTREQLRVIQSLSLPAEDRYENFLNKYPHIAALLTQKQIASYLGVTPEFLSVVRKKRMGR